MTFFKHFLTFLVLVLVLSLVLSFVSKDNQVYNESDFGNNIVQVIESDVAVNMSSECDPCNCAGIYQSYLNAYSNCIVFGGYYCTLAQQYWSAYQSCLHKEPECPNGFIYDGCNCYSGVHFPQGYVGFVWGNGFYVVQNCGISPANNCCPPGFTFDGANCHYFGLYFPAGYQGFVWNNAFYTTPGPCN